MYRLNRESHMARVLRTISALLACLALSACFVSKAPLIPAERAVKLMPDRGTLTTQAGDAPDPDADTFTFRWTGTHYDLTGVTGKESPKRGTWAFADIGQGYYIVQMDHGETEDANDPDDAVEYYVVRRGEGSTLILFVPECKKLSDEERLQLKLEVKSDKPQCQVATFPQLEAAITASLKTLEEPNTKVIITPAP